MDADMSYQESAFEDEASLDDSEVYIDSDPARKTHSSPPEDIFVAEEGLPAREAVTRVHEKSVSQPRRRVSSHKVVSVGVLLLILVATGVTLGVLLQDSNSSSTPAASDQPADRIDPDDLPLDDRDPSISTPPPTPASMQQTPDPTSSPTIAQTLAPTKPVPSFSPSSRGATLEPTATATPTTATPSRSPDVMDQLALVSDPSTLSDPSSPQAKAADWLLVLDDVELAVDSPNLYQRYALAVLYFSTGGGIVDRHGWDKCSGNPEPIPDNTSFQGLRCVVRDGKTLCAEAIDFLECIVNGKTMNRFLSSVGECEWFGMTCDAIGQVTEINLQLNNLNGTLPPEIRLLDSLQKAELEYNSIQGTLPTELGTMSNMKKLFLDNNVIEGSIPSEIGMMTNLEKLFLLDNSITGSLPEEFYSLTNLKNLHIERNKLTGTMSPAIGNLGALTNLRAEGNNFRGGLPTELGLLKKLDGLSVHWNLYTGEMPSQVCKLKLDTLRADCLPDVDGNVLVDCKCCTACCSSVPKKCD